MTDTSFRKEGRVAGTLPDYNGGMLVVDRGVIAYGEALREQQEAVGRVAVAPDQSREAHQAFARRVQRVGASALEPFQVAPVVAQALVIVEERSDRSLGKREDLRLDLSSDDC